MERLYGTLARIVDIFLVREGHAGHVRVTLGKVFLQLGLGCHLFLTYVAGEPNLPETLMHFLQNILGLICLWKSFCLL